MIIPLNGHNFAAALQRSAAEASFEFMRSLWNQNFSGEDSYGHVNAWYKKACKQLECCWAFFSALCLPE